MAKKKQPRSKALARIGAVSVFKLHQLPTITAYLDTGYSRQETVNIIKQMYKNKPTIDIKTVDWACVLLKWEPASSDEEYGVTADLFNKNGMWDFELKFGSNWNDKLNCHCFTSIRLYNKLKHVPGKLVRIYWPDEVTRMKKKIK